MKAEVVTLCAIIALTSLVSYILVVADPIRDYVSTDGVLHIRGSMTGAFLDYLQYGPRPRMEVRHLVVIGHPGGTMSWTEQVLDVHAVVFPEVGGPKSRAPSLQEIVAPVADALKMPVVLLFDFLTGTASAAAKTWDGGGANNNWNTAANWDLNTLPVANDSVTFNGTSTKACTVNIAVPVLTGFNVNSGYTNTITLSIAQTNTWGPLSFGAGTTGTVSTAGFATIIGSLSMSAGTLTAGASTITVNGNFNFASGTFTYGTSTIAFAASGTITAPTWVSQRSVYNLTINVGVTMTVAVGQASIGIVNVLTVNGTLALGNESLTMFNDAGGTAPLVVGASSAYTGTADAAELEFFDQAGTLVNIPADDYGNVFFKIGPSVAVAGDGFEYRLAGNITVNRIEFNIRAGAPFFVNTQTFNLTIANITDGVDMASPPAFGIKATSGTWTQSGGIVLNNTGSLNFYLQLGSTSWTFTSTAPSGFAWSLASVTVSANWNVGTSTITFTAAGGAAFRFASGTGNEFNNVTFQGSGGTPDRFYAFTNDATNSIDVAGTMTISDSVSTTEFDVLNTGTPINVNAGTITVGSGGILTTETSTITISGNFTNTGTVTTSAGTTFALSGTSTQTMSGGTGLNYQTLQITGSSVKAFTQGFTTTSQSTTATGATMRFTAGIIWTHNGLTISGPVGGLLLLRSATPGTSWSLLNAGGTQAQSVDAQDSSASDLVTACDSMDSGGNLNWDFTCGAGGPGPRSLRINPICSYNPFTVTWDCLDRTDYSGWLPQVFQTLRYQYDGIGVATASTRGSAVSFRAPGETWLNEDSDHLLIVVWTLSNGGTPSATLVLHVDNRPAQILMAVVGVGLLAILVAAIMRARGGATAYERVQNPSYRRTAIAIEEYPKGWRSYRQRPYRPELPTRSERHGDHWIIYQLRPATADEQARTGRKRIAYVQTVREKI